MGIRTTIKQVEKDLEQGDLSKARDRLEGLLSTYPESLAIRQRLGEIYWQLRYPDRAGRNWYLLPTTKPEMDEARRRLSARVETMRG